MTRTHRADVTVLTPTVDTRSEGLVRAMASVANQTWGPRNHLISYDIHRYGGAWAANQLVPAVTTEYCMILPDDDAIDSTYVAEHLLAFKEYKVDIVSSYCRTEGREFTWYNTPWGDPLKGSPHREGGGKYKGNIAHVAMFRTSLFEKVGMFHAGQSQWDFMFWEKCIEAKAKVYVIEEILWTYGLTGGNVSHGQVP